MTRFLFLVLSALLILLTTVHAGDEFIRVYSFTTDLCYGPPQLVNIDLKINECHNLPIGAHSLKPFKHEDDIKWVNDINNGGSHCEFISYKLPGCLDDQKLAAISLPFGIQQCLRSNNVPAHAIKFSCGINPKTISAVVTTRTTTITAISWSFDKDDKPTPYYTTDTFTFTQTNQVPSKRSAEPIANQLEPRVAKDENRKNVWMLHPWSQSVICYTCYNKESFDFNTMECRSGPGLAIECPARAIDSDGSFSTVTQHVTSTTTSTLTATTTATALTTISTTLTVSAELEEAELEKRKSWHRRVTFDHPFFPNTKLCADAEWEKRGKEENHIKLQKISTNQKKCDKADQVWDLDAHGDRLVVTPHTVTQEIKASTTATVTRTIAMIPVVSEGLAEDVAAARDNVPVHKDL